MITYLYVKDFRNISEIEIEPSKKINLIQGGNGQGKSSLLQAIKYVFTDELDDKISEYVRWGKDKFIIKCNFTIGSDEYKYYIEGDKGAKKVLTINDVDTYKNSEATKKLAEILNPIILKHSAISEQHKTVQILFDTPTETLKKLKYILGVDKLSLIVDEMKEEQKEKKNKVDLIKKEIELLENKKYNYLDEVKIDTDIDSLNAKKEKLELEKTIYDQQVLLYNNYVKDKEFYDKQISQKVIDLEQLKKYQQESDNFLIPKTDRTLLSSQLTEFENSLIEKEKKKIQTEQNNKEYNTLSININELSNKIQENVLKLEDYKLRRLPLCDITEESLNNIITDINVKTVVLNQNKQQLELAKQGKCPTCGQDCTHYNSEELEKQIDLLEIEIEILSNQWKKDKQTLKDYTELVNEQSIIKVQRDNLKNKINEQEIELSNLKEKLSQITVDDIDYNSEILTIKNNIQTNKKLIEEYDSIVQQKSLIDEKIKSLELRLKDYDNIIEPQAIVKPLDFNNEDYLFILKEINVYEERLKEKEKVELYNSQLKVEEKADRDKIDQLYKDIDSIEFEVGVIKESIQVLDKEFPSYLIDKGAKIIKEYMNDFFQKAYGRYEITFEQTKNSISFYYGDESNVAPCSIAGGLEKAILAIALRIALLKLQNIDFLSLDEIDSDASTENSMALYETIISYCSDMQIFAVTHLDDTKEYLMQHVGSQNYEFQNGKII
jgi:DNA repair exonuclease SbcCD ATPase subunit